MSTPTPALRTRESRGWSGLRTVVYLGPMAELIESGLRSILAPYADRVVVRECGGPISETDLLILGPASVLAPAARHALARDLGSGHHRGRWVCYGDAESTWRSELLFRAFPGRLQGWVSTGRTASELVSALERIDGGELVFDAPSQDLIAALHPLPELTQREAQVLILIASGMSNVQIAECLCVSMNTVKSYIRTAYQKIGVESRRQAVLWGVEQGLSRWSDVFSMGSAISRQESDQGHGDRSIA